MITQDRGGIFVQSVYLAGHRLQCLWLNRQ